MSLFGRLFGGGDEESYLQGIALYEKGEFAESIQFFRKATANQDFSPVRSLAAFHLRQALINESRRLLRKGEAAAALPHLLESTENWDRFPDLHFLLGAAQGLSGDWGQALRSARSACRLNADYCEARLLEACALQQLHRLPECADSLNALLETGRRRSHWLIKELTCPGGYHSDSLPDTLIDNVVQAAGGRNQGDEAAAAAKLCRSGRWEQGVKSFAALVERYPKYPDYRVQYAAALFQLHRHEASLDEIAASLEMDEHYRAALYLRGLVLADLGRLEEAREGLAAAFSNGQTVDTNSHEDLFICYLRAVLELLVGNPGAALTILEPWPDLSRSFARAEMLRAAAEYFLEQLPPSEHRLAKLVEVWPAEEEYHFFYGCLLVQQRKYEQAEAALRQWPPATDDDNGGRHTLLDAELALAKRQPLPEGISTTIGRIARYQPAGRFHRAQALVRSQDWVGCWAVCEELIEQGYCTERVAALQRSVLAKFSETQVLPPDWQPPVAPADTTVVEQVHAANRSGRAGDSMELIGCREKVHPTRVDWSWLSAGFWIDPVRSWIG